MGIAVGGKGCRRRDPARVAAQGFHHHDVDGQALHVAADFRHAARHIPRRTAEARRVVGDGQVVVHGLGDADDVDAPLGAAGIQLAAGIHGAVAAVHEDIADAVFLENGHHSLILGGFQGVPAGADGGGRAGQQAAEFCVGDVGDVPQLFVQQTAGAADGRIHPVHQRAVLGLTDGAVQGGVDDGGGAAAMHDEKITGHGRPPFSRSRSRRGDGRTRPCSRRRGSSCTDGRWWS